MSVLRYQIFKRWRDYLRGGRRPTPPVPVDEPQEDPDTEIPGKSEPDTHTVLLSYAGTEIPVSCIDGNSDKYLIKPDSGKDGKRGLVILIPWKFVGWVEYAEILTNQSSYALRDSTRNYSLHDSPAYPNGARVHLRSKYSGQHIGYGTIRVRVKDGSWLSWIGSFAKRSGDLILTPEGPAPLAQSVLGFANANAEEINDLVYHDHTIQIPESWQIFQVMLFTFPLEGATMLKRVRIGGQEEKMLIFEIPEICRNHSSLVIQFQSSFSHVSYETVFDPRESFTGAGDHLVIYTPVGLFPSHTHDQRQFQEASAGKWKRVK